MTDMPQDPTAHAHWILFQLRRVGSSFSELADELGVDRHTVSQAAHRPYLKMEQAIAAKLGVPPEQLWPERYAHRARRAQRSQTRVMTEASPLRVLQPATPAVEHAMATIAAELPGCDERGAA